MASNLHPTERDLKDYRPIPFYFITTDDPNELTYEKAYDSLSRMKADGFGGIVLFNKPPHGFTAEGYLSDVWFNMVRNFVRAACELDLSVWLNDGFNFPPGDGGGRITKETHPHLMQKKLELQNGKAVAVDVAWGAPAFELPESAALFHEIVYEPYKAAVGDYFGTTVKGIFSDADNRRVNFGVFGSVPEQKDYFPWSSDFALTFADVYGYDIKPYLVSILRKESSPQAKDYWEHAGRLYQGWFASNYRWCRENGLEYTFHTSDTSPFAWEEAPRSSLFTEGRALDMESNCDYPGTDQELLELNGGKHMRKEEYWLPKVSYCGGDADVRNPAYRDLYGDLRPKQAGSTAFLYHKKGAMCEMFAATNWGATFTDLREIASVQIMNGINFIVPHAYHYRLCGDTKYFAPPDFSPHSHLADGMRIFNDMLAKNCWYASQGTLQAPVAVLDITDDVWAGKTDSKAFCDVCLALDRLPYGYVIADDKMIRANRDAFSVVVNAGAPLSETRAAFFDVLDLPVVGVESIEEIGQYVDCDVLYVGDGMPHFMRRQLDDGTQLVIVCGFETDVPVQGTLQIGASSLSVFLQPGEMGFYTAQGRIGCDALPMPEGNRIALPDETEVVWESENCLPIECWLDESGDIVPKTDICRQLRMSYFVDDSVTDLSLTMTARCAARIDEVKVDAILLASPTECMIFDDKSYKWELPVSAMTPGDHVLTIRTHAPLPKSDIIALRGSFDVTVATQGAYHRVSGKQYSLKRYIPEQVGIVLSKRTTILQTTRSWCAQGHPFYSGAATYRFLLSQPKEYGDAVLHLKNVRDVCTVSIDGKEVEKRIFAPYDFALGNLDGEHLLEITVRNTLGNALEFYCAPSGLLGGGDIYTAKDTSNKKR